MSTPSYDTLDRPLTVSYPGNEDLLLTYDHEGAETLAFQIGTTTPTLSPISALTHADNC